MAEKKSRFTVEEHDKLGRELQIFDVRLYEIGTKIREAYPFSEKAYDKAIEAREAVRLLRYELENLLCREQQGNKDIKVLNVYHRMGSEEFNGLPDFDSSTVVLAKSSVD